jgi:DNA-binding MarR family transcriptional regulator
MPISGTTKIRGAAAGKAAAATARRGATAADAGERAFDVAAHLRLAVTRTARRLRQEAGRQLSPSQISALATIERHGPLTPSELADRERVKRPTATRVAAKLEELGTISRAVDPADGRSSRLRITSAGRALLARLRNRKTAYLAQRLGALEADDLETLDRAAALLERMLEGERL